MIYFFNDKVLMLHFPSLLVLRRKALPLLGDAKIFKNFLKKYLTMRKGNAIFDMSVGYAAGRLAFCLRCAGSDKVRVHAITKRNGNLSRK